MFKLDLEKAEEPELKLPTSIRSLKKQESSKKTSAAATAAAAKSLQSCLTLCDPIDGSPPGSPIPGILQAKKTSTSASLTTQKPLTVWITINYGKFLKRWEYQTTLPTFWETCMQVKKWQLELDMEQQTGSK